MEEVKMYCDSNGQITKEGLEKFLDYEINDFKVEPVIYQGKEVGLSIMVHTKQQIEHINIDFK